MKRLPFGFAEREKPELVPAVETDPLVPEGRKPTGSERDKPERVRVCSSRSSRASSTALSFRRHTFPAVAAGKQRKAHRNEFRCAFLADGGEQGRRFRSGGTHGTFPRRGFPGIRPFRTRTFGIRTSSSPRATQAPERGVQGAEPSSAQAPHQVPATRPGKAEGLWAEFISPGAGGFLRLLKSVSATSPQAPASG